MRRRPILLPLISFTGTLTAYCLLISNSQHVQGLGSQAAQILIPSRRVSLGEPPRGSSPEMNNEERRMATSQADFLVNSPHVIHPRSLYQRSSAARKPPSVGAGNVALDISFLFVCGCG